MATIEELQAEITSLKQQIAHTQVSRQENSSDIVTYYSRWAAGAGLLSPPVLDLAAVTAVQVRMVKRLATHYGKSFDARSGRALVAALSGALAPAFVGQGGLKLLLKAFGPGFISDVAGTAAVPALNYGSTHLVGRFFQKHFEAAGDEKPDLAELSRQIASSVASVAA